MLMRSAVYRGEVRHRRFGDRPHRFNYGMYMMAIDLDELDVVCRTSRVFGTRWFNPIRFQEKDYLKSEPGELKQRISNKVAQLGGHWQGEKVVMMAQCRCLGLYFSPINFYFCYDNNDVCKYMLAEVSNTPWNQRHYYLVDLEGDCKTDKVFHVSPFMEMDMQYHWKIVAPEHKVMVHIENHQHSKVFDATLAMTREEITPGSLLKTWLSTPMMTGKMIAGIYWQALKLFCKRVPFVAHPES
ncbi:DUF1365 domain-containing protein [Shewanella waksmanii]|uniref:DUF1365 domain-containing protein n=1 Tax=Shewanella waksmanii TaxID=213783 RepID=UPI0037363E4E